MHEASHRPAVLFIGEEPEAVDFADPALPPGLDAAKIRGGIDAAMKDMADRGWHADLCLVRTDASAEAAVAQRIASRRYDCIVIGGGIRVVPGNMLVFERLLNTVHRNAPDAAIAFNTSPEDTADAAARWMRHDQGRVPPSP